MTGVHHIRTVTVEDMPRGMALFAGPPVDDGEQQIVVIKNLSFDKAGRTRKLTQNRLLRWWRARRGWTHYVGEHRS